MDAWYEDVSTRVTIGMAADLLSAAAIAGGYKLILVKKQNNKHKKTIGHMGTNG